MRVAALGHDHIDLAGDEIGGQRGQPIRVALAPAVFDRHVLSLNIAGFAQSLAKSGLSSSICAVMVGLKPPRKPITGIASAARVPRTAGRSPWQHQAM